jgi:thiamine biosynthesis lipoprotein
VKPPGRVEFRALGTTALLLVTEPARLRTAERVLRDELAAVDLACSRFREDSEISKLHLNAGHAAQVSPLLAEAIRVALRAAWLSGGLVDLTVGTAVRELGYDRDFAAIPQGTGADKEVISVAPGPAPGWHRVLFDPAAAEVVLPRGIQLDLGATAKALAADRAAAAVLRETGSGVLISLGGDISVAGPPPAGDWLIGVGDDHARAAVAPATTVTLRSGGLATSSITQRTWRRAGRVVHHIVDPRTGDIPAPFWRTVSVAAGSCVDANTATTAAIVLGAAAPEWLSARGLPSRLVDVTGHVVVVAGWPAEPQGSDAAALDSGHQEGKAA